MKAAFFNSPLLLVAGQCYLHKEYNEYIILSKVNRGLVTFEGNGFRGVMDGYDFIEKFPPVDPTDIPFDEVQNLLNRCPETVEEAITGFITEFEFDEKEEQEEDLMS